MSIVSEFAGLAAAVGASGLVALAARRELGAPLHVSLPALAVLMIGITAGLRMLGVEAKAALALAALMPCCALIAEIDRRSFIIPDRLVIAIAVLALASPLGAHWQTMALGGASLGLMFLAVRASFALAGRDHVLGLGDAKLAAAIGLFLGLQSGLLAVSIAGLATLSVMLAGRRAIPSEPAAFGAGAAPFGVGLAAALAVVSALEVWGAA